MPWLAAALRKPCPNKKLVPQAPGAASGGWAYAPTMARALNAPEPPTFHLLRIGTDLPVGG